MERQQVDSSNINSVGYDEATQTLEIEYKKGVYQYVDVPKEVYERMMKAPSIGSFVREIIINTYSYHRL
jgi:hypothetical protein